MSAAWWPRAGCLVTVALSLATVPTAGAAPLRLDSGFVEGGIARVRFGIVLDPADTRPLRPVRQPDGKLLVAAARYEFHGNAQILVARFTRRGRPDPTFGHGGRVRLGYRWNFAPQELQVQPDGRILVLGAAGYGPFFYPSPGQFGLLRLLPDGSRDPTFGTNGLVAWNPPWHADTLSLYALPRLFVPQADGRVLAVGTVSEQRQSGDPYSSLIAGLTPWIVFVRFNDNGSADESFRRAGVPEELENTPLYFHAWAALPDGHFVTLATRYATTHPWWLIRFNHDGTLDQGFGQDGTVRLELPYPILNLVPTRDGGLIIPREELHRIDPGGQLDTSFGTTCPRSSLGPPEYVAATADGGLLATAVSRPRHVRPPRIYSFVLRYGPDGCATGRPLRLRSVSAGPLSLHGRRTALVSATYGHTPAGFARGLALIRIRR